MLYTHYLVKVEGKETQTEIKYYIFLFDKSWIIQDFLAVFLNVSCERIQEKLWKSP